MSVYQYSTRTLLFFSFSFLFPSFFFFHDSIYSMFVRSNIHRGRDACCVAFRLGFGMAVLVVRAQAFLYLFFPFYTPFFNYSFKHRE